MTERRNKSKVEKKFGSRRLKSTFKQTKNASILLCRVFYEGKTMKNIKTRDTLAEYSPKGERRKKSTFQETCPFSGGGEGG